MRNPTPIDQLASSFVQTESPNVNDNSWVKYVLVGGVLIAALAITYVVIKDRKEKELLNR